MFVRRRPLLRAAVVGGGAYAMGKRSARRTAQETGTEADQNAWVSGREQAPRGSGESAAEPSVTDQLAQLSRLHQQGSLSDSEFAAAKTRLLGS